MSLATELAYGLAQLIAEQRATITYRRVTTLAGSNPAPNPPNVEQLVVAGTTLSGSTAINFRALVLTGRLLAGDTFQIAGDPMGYTVTAQTISPPPAETLTGVPFAPSLQRNAADGAAVTLTFAADTLLQGLLTNYPAHLINGETILQDDHQLRFLASALPFRPTAGDVVLFHAGIDVLFHAGIDVGKVIRVKHMENQGTLYGWSLQVRA